MACAGGPDAYRRGRAVEGVRRLVAEHPGNVVLLTSRIVGYEGAIEREAESSEAEVQAAHKRAEDLQAAIEGNPGVQALAENPLLLTIIALVNWRGRRLPDRRVDLYQHAADGFLGWFPFPHWGDYITQGKGRGLDQA